MVATIHKGTLVGTPALVVCQQKYIQVPLPFAPTYPDKYYIAHQKES